MKQVKLSLEMVQDYHTRENFKILQDLIDKLVLPAERFRVLEIFLDANVEELKISHGLGFTPLDVFPTRLIAPSGAKLTILHSKSDAQNLYLTVSGLSSGVLNARLVVGSFPNVVTMNSRPRGDNESQEFKSKV